MNFLPSVDAVETDLLSLNDQDLEEKVICSVTMIPAAYDIASEKGLLPEHFCDSLCREIFSIFQNRGGAVDINIIVSDLATSGIFSRDRAMAGIVNILGKDDFGSEYNLPHRVDHLIELHRRKQLYTEELQRLSAIANTSVPLQEIVRQMQDRANTYAQIVSSSKDIFSYADMVQSVFDDINGDTQSSETVVFESNIGELDHDLLPGGFTPALDIFLGRPSMGKTTLCLFLVLQAAQQGVPCYVASREMTLLSLSKKITSMKSNVSLRLGRQSFTESEINKIVFALGDDTNNLIHMSARNNGTVSEICGHLDWIKKTSGSSPKVVMVDYLQLMRPSVETRGSNEASRLASVVKECKDRLVLERNCVVLLPSQLNRGVEATNDKTPGMAFGKGTGAIEEGGDRVWGIKRKSYYSDETPEEDPTFDLYLWKNRYGPAGQRVSLIWDSSTGIIGSPPHSVYYSGD